MLLLNPRYLSVFERYFHIFVHINLLRPKVDDLLRLAHRGFDLIGGHTLLDALGFGLRLRLRVVSGTLLALISALLLAALEYAGA